MKKSLMALAAVATLAVSAVAVPAPAHAQRGVAAGVAAGLIGGAIVGGAIASQNGYYYGPGYYGPATAMYGRSRLCRRLLRPLLLAAPALLGRLWLARPQRPGLRLIPFIFIKSARDVPENAGFPGRCSCSGQKKPLFQATSPAAFTSD